MMLKMLEVDWFKVWKKYCKMQYLQECLQGRIFLFFFGNYIHNMVANLILWQIKISTAIRHEKNVTIEITITLYGSRIQTSAKQRKMKAQHIRQGVVKHILGAWAACKNHK